MNDQNNKFNEFLATVPWTRVHGGLDLLGEMCLATAAISAAVTLGAAAVPYAAFGLLIIPDMIHSLACLMGGDGSQASAEKSKTLAENNPDYVDPQDKYAQALSSFAAVSSHLFGRKKLGSEELELHKKQAAYLLRLTWDLKNHPNETGRLYEAAGKVGQTLMGGAAALAFNPLGGALQAAAGLLNAGGVAFDFLPEKDVEHPKNLMENLQKNGQKYAGITQLAATALYVPAAIAFGISTPVGMALAVAVVAWTLGYGCKTLATKRGYNIH